MKKIWIGINSVKNKFTLQNVSSLPVGSLLTDWSAKRKHGPLPSSIGFSSPPPLSLSLKNKFTLQNVSSLPVGSLRTGQRKQNMVLWGRSSIGFSLSLARGKKSKFSLQNVFPPAGGFIIDRAAKRKHDTLPGHTGFSLSGKQVYSPKRFFPALRIVSLSEKQVYPPKRFFPALRILSLSLFLREK